MLILGGLDSTVLRYNEIIIIILIMKIIIGIIIIDIDVLVRFKPQTVLKGKSV